MVFDGCFILYSVFLKKINFLIWKTILNTVKFTIGNVSVIFIHLVYSVIVFRYLMELTIVFIRYEILEF
jgi:hypothetical protein